MSDKFAWLGRVAVMGLLLAVMLIFLGGLAFCAQQLAQEYEEVAGALRGVLSEATQDTGMAGGEDTGQAAADGEGGSAPAPADTEAAGSGSAADSGSASESEGRGGLGLLRNIGGGLAEAATLVAQTVAGATGQMIAGMVIVFFLVLLALSERDTFLKKVCDRLSREQRGTLDTVLDQASHRLRLYILVRAGVGLLNAALYVAWLGLFGLDLLLVWAILTFLLNFIPNIGSIISGMLPFLYAFVTLDPGMALLLGLGLFVIEQIIGNYVDPKLQGRQISLSALVILVALLFWYWLWGVAGALLAVPMTMIAVVLCTHIPPLRPLALFLSDQDDEAELCELMGCRALTGQSEGAAARR
jgi:AI-2 transport protein TqsA